MEIYYYGDTKKIQAKGFIEKRDFIFAANFIKQIRGEKLLYFEENILWKN